MPTLIFYKGKSEIKLFIPLLLFYVFFIFFFTRDFLWADEGRYLQFAENLTKGYYSPLDIIDLWNGPGYPLILTVFVFFRSPIIIPKLLNAVFLFFAVYFFYLSIQNYVPKKDAVVYAYILGLMPNFFWKIKLLLTEPYITFLISLFSFFILKIFNQQRRKAIYIILCSFVLALTALTKVIFGYVILLCLIIFLFLFFMLKKQEYKIAFFIFFLSLILSTPYLYYTWRLTGNFFYWGNSGGMSLYWMSTPYSNEFGDWISFEEVNPKKISLYKNHGAFIDKIKNLDPIQKDRALQKRALENIRNHPRKFAFNWFCNLGRMIFSYPFTFAKPWPSTLFYMIFNSPIFVFCSFAAVLTVLNRKKNPFVIILLLIFITTYLGMSSLFSAEVRMVTIILPIICIWLVYVFNNFMIINIKKSNFK